MNKPLLSALACALLSSAGAAQAQDFPEGPGKQIVTAVCGACHDITRIRVGYTPEGWRTEARRWAGVRIARRDRWGSGLPPRTGR